SAAGTTTSRVAAATAPARAGAASGNITAGGTTTGTTTGSAPPASTPAQSDTDSMAAPRDSPGFRSASGPSSRCSVSTYQAVAGPLDRARATPLSTYAARNAQNVAATLVSSSATVRKAAETATMPRRPSTSARPPVGSSRVTVTTEK